MKHIFKGKLLNLYLDKRRIPNGAVVRLEIIKHPGAILVVPFLNDNKVVMIRQYRPVIGSYIWELPAGTLKKKESPLKCAARELAEETGYCASRWKKIGYIYPAPGYTTEKIIIYAAYGLRKIKAQTEEDEVIITKPLKKKDILKLFDKRKIVDAKTICALRLLNTI